MVTNVEQDKKVPLKERFHILRTVPGYSKNKIFLAEDQQSGSHVFLHLARWGNEETLVSTFEKHTTLQQHSELINPAHALFTQHKAEHTLTSLSHAQFRELSTTHNTEYVLVSDAYTPVIYPTSTDLTLHHLIQQVQTLRTNAHETNTSYPKERSIEICASIGRALVHYLQDIHAVQWVHGSLEDTHIIVQHEPKQWLQKDMSSLPISDLIRIVDVQTSAPTASPIPVERGNLTHQSPERLRALLGDRTIQSDPKDDIFSLGILLYQLCTGTLPYTPADTLSWLERANWMLKQWEISEAPLVLECIDITEDIVHMIQNMCATDREKRPTAQEVQACFAQEWSNSKKVQTSEFMQSLPPSMDAMILHAARMAELSQTLLQTEELTHSESIRFLPQWFNQLAEKLQMEQEESRQAQFQMESQHTEQLQTIEELQSKFKELRLELNKLQQQNEKQNEKHEKQLQVIRQEAFEEAYQDAYQKAQEESFQRADELLLIQSNPTSHPMQTQNGLGPSLEDVEYLEEQLIQIQQEYHQIRSLFRMEREKIHHSIEHVLESLDTRDTHEHNELQGIQSQLDEQILQLNEQLHALQAEQQLVQASLSGLHSRFNVRNEVRQAPTLGTLYPIETPVPETDPSYPTEEGPVPHTYPLTLDDPIEEEPKHLQTVSPLQTRDFQEDSFISMDQLLSPSSLLPQAPTPSMTTELRNPQPTEDLHIQLGEFASDEPEVIVGTPAIPSFEDLISVHMSPPGTPPPIHQSPLIQKLSAVPAIQQISEVIRSDIWAFFGQLERIDWFQGQKPPQEVRSWMHKHIQRLEPFAQQTGQRLPKLLAIFRSGTHTMHQYMAPSELLNAKVEEIFETSLKQHPDDWSQAGGAVWDCLRSFMPQTSGSVFEHPAWLVPWDTACDTILETTWFAANDVAWSAARSSPRFAASDAAADAANYTQRARARSAIWSTTWEYTRFAATGSLWSASNNAASDVANDVAWRLIQDQMAPKNILNPFAPLMQIWAGGWWPILLSSGDYIIWSPLQDPNAMDVIWEYDAGASTQ